METTYIAQAEDSVLYDRVWMFGNGTVGKRERIDLWQPLAFVVGAEVVLFHQIK